MKSARSVFVKVAPVFWTVCEGAALSADNDFLLYVLATNFDPKDEEIRRGQNFCEALSISLLSVLGAAFIYEMDSV